MSGTGRAARGLPKRPTGISSARDPANVGLRYQWFDREELSSVVKAPIGVEPLFADGVRPVAAHRGVLRFQKPCC